MQDLRESLSVQAVPAPSVSEPGPAESNGGGEDQADVLPHEEEPHEIVPPQAHGLQTEQATDIILRIRPSRLALSTALEKASRWTLSDTELTIYFTSQYPANAARGEEEVIRNAAADVLGKPVLVRIRVDADGSDADTGAEDPEQDSKVDMVKRVFRGEIVDG